MTTDPNWLKSITESYRQEVSESARNLQEEAEDLYNLVETIQTALQVDLTEAQVKALISALSETKSGLSQKTLEDYYLKSTYNRDRQNSLQGMNSIALRLTASGKQKLEDESKTAEHKAGRREGGQRRAIRALMAYARDGDGGYGGDTKYI